MAPRKRQENLRASKEKSISLEDIRYGRRWNLKEKERREEKEIRGLRQWLI